MAKAKVNFVELNQALKPMNKNTINSIERNSARFIYVSKDRTAKCERCESEFTLANAKHNSMVKCPSCKRTMQVIHSWRKQKNSSIHWEVSAQAISNTQLVLRYYLVQRVDGKITESAERARYFIDTVAMQDSKFELSIWDNDWKKSGARFFRQYGMRYAENKLCCLGADIRESFFTETKKLDVLKYIDLKPIFETGNYATCLCWYVERANLYEKLQKVGLINLILADLRTYHESEMIKYNKNESELTKMLGITKNALEMLKAHSSLNGLRLLQKNPNIAPKDYETLYLFAEYEISNLQDCAKKINVSLYKFAKYYSTQGFSIWEYNNYLNLLERLNYNINDKSYSMPKDFHKEYSRIEGEIKKLKDEFEAKKNELIKAISDRISSMPELKEFFNGSKGYMVYVPSSVEDFVNEGKNQHNCVGGDRYTEAVAKEKTLVVYIREINNPEASFVTMEYSHGAIVQCMFDRNRRVEHDSEVYSFAEAFAERLRQKNILVA